MVGTGGSSHKAKSQISSENKIVFEEERQKQTNKTLGASVGPSAVSPPWQGGGAEGPQAGEGLGKAL